MNQRFVTNDRKIHDTFVVRFQKVLIRSDVMRKYNRSISIQYSTQTNND